MRPKSAREKARNVPGITGHEVVSKLSHIISV